MAMDRYAGRPRGDPTTTARLRELHESGRVEIQWLTTWAENADQLPAEPLGLPRGLRTRSAGRPAPTGFLGRLGGRSGWWKLAAAARSPKPPAAEMAISAAWVRIRPSAGRVAAAG
jgi:hypothetical protein